MPCVHLTVSFTGVPLISLHVTTPSPSGLHAGGAPGVQLPPPLDDEEDEEDDDDDDEVAGQSCSIDEADASSSQLFASRHASWSSVRLLWQRSPQPFEITSAGAWHASSLVSQRAPHCSAVTVAALPDDDPDEPPEEEEVEDVSDVHAATAAKAKIGARR